MADLVARRLMEEAGFAKVSRQFSVYAQRHKKDMKVAAELGTFGIFQIVQS